MSTEKVDRIALGIEFEKWCRAFLVKLGFKVYVTRVTGDGGIDLLAFMDRPIFAGKYVVQCKRFQERVSESIIRDLYGVVTAERANKGILITTGTFSENAKQFAEEKPIELIDGDQFTTMLNEHEVDIGLAKYDLDSYQNIISDDFNYALLNQRLEYSKNNKRLRSHVIDNLYNLFIEYAEFTFNDVQYQASLDFVIRELERHLIEYFAYKPRGDKKLYHSQFAYCILYSDICLYYGKLNEALKYLEKFLNDSYIKQKIEEIQSYELDYSINFNTNIYLVLKRILLIQNIIGNENAVNIIKEKYKNIFKNWELPDSTGDSSMADFYLGSYSDRKYPFPNFICDNSYYNQSIDVNDANDSINPKYHVYSFYLSTGKSREIYKENGYIVIENFTRIKPV